MAEAITLPPHAGGHACNMNAYSCIFFKTMLSSDGHPCKALQHQVRVARAKSVQRAIKAAGYRFERARKLSDWRLNADEVDVVLEEPPQNGTARAIPYSVDACSDLRLAAKTHGSSIVPR